MGHAAVTKSTTGPSARPSNGSVVIKNTALRRRSYAKTGAPTTQGARPGRNDGAEWLHRPTTEHVFGDLPAEPSAPASRVPWGVIAAVAVVAGAVAALFAAL